MSLSLTIEGLTKSFGGKTVLNKVDFFLEAGSVLGVLGPSGCGKSTLLRLVAGLDIPSKGTIRLGEKIVSTSQGIITPEKRSINMVFQDYALWPHMRVQDIVAYGLNRKTSLEKTLRVNKLLDMMQISELRDRFPAQLSGGQQQRVAIARALATEPDLLLFDEPLSNLDVQLRQEMRIELSDLLAELRTTALYVTHDPEEASSVSTTMLILRNGEVEGWGAPEEMFRKPSSIWIAYLAGYTNTLNGIIKEVEATSTIVSVAGQDIQVSVRESFELIKEKPVKVMMNPSLMSLNTPNQGEGNNIIEGIVKTCTLEGRLWRIRISLNDGSDLMFWNSTAVAKGEKVGVIVAIEETLAFKPAKFNLDSQGVEEANDQAKNVRVRKKLFRANLLQK